MAPALAGCSDDGTAATTSTTTWGERYLTGTWPGALGTNEEYEWTFTDNGAFSRVDPAGEQPTAKGKWAVEGTTLKLAVVTAQGKTNSERFVAKVTDANHVELGSKDMGSWFKLHCKNTATQPATRL